MAYSKPASTTYRSKAASTTSPDAQRLGRVPSLPLLVPSQYIEFKADTVVESQNAIDTTNLAYIVLPGVQLVFRAPAVSLKRGEVRLIVTPELFGLLIDLLDTYRTTRDAHFFPSLHSNAPQHCENCRPRKAVYVVIFSLHRLSGNSRSNRGKRRRRSHHASKLEDILPFLSCWGVIDSRVCVGRRIGSLPQDRSSLIPRHVRRLQHTPNLVAH